MCGSGKFLYNDAGAWFLYDSRSNVNTPAPGGPAFAHGNHVYSALSDAKLYFARGGGSTTGGQLYKYVVGTGFSSVVLPAPFTAAMYPLWALFRLIYAYENTLIISDILDPEIFDLTNQTLTLDPIKSDYITGMCLWQGQQIAVFRNGSTWMVQTGPNLPVLNWEVDRASATVGCCCHGTIVQCGVDVFFFLRPAAVFMLFLRCRPVARWGFGKRSVSRSSVTSIGSIGRHPVRTGYLLERHLSTGGAARWIDDQ